MIPKLKIEICKPARKIHSGGLKIPVKSRGFTVLESIVAIFILSLSISGAFSAIFQGLSQSNIAKDETQAFYLAQEAVEMLRNKRDSNQLRRINSDPSYHWLSDISEDASDPCYFGTVCRADAVSNSFVACGEEWGGCPVLRQDASTFLYNYSSGPNSRFTREIRLEPINTNEISATIVIRWRKGIIQREFKVKTHFFNWI